MAKERPVAEIILTENERMKFLKEIDAAWPDDGIDFLEELQKLLAAMAGLAFAEDFSRGDIVSRE